MLDASAGGRCVTLLKLMSDTRPEENAISVNEALRRTRVNCDMRSTGSSSTSATAAAMTPAEVTTSRRWLRTGRATTSRSQPATSARKDAAVGRPFEAHAFLHPCRDRRVVVAQLLDPGQRRHLVRRKAAQLLGRVQDFVGLRKFVEPRYHNRRGSAGQFTEGGRCGGHVSPLRADLHFVECGTRSSKMQPGCGRLALTQFGQRVVMRGTELRLAMPHQQ